jgi:hypothetical protein
MEEFVALLAMVYFVAVILGIYHVQQKDIDRLSRQIGEIIARSNPGGG